MYDMNEQEKSPPVKSINGERVQPVNIQEIFMDRIIVVKL